MLIKDTPTHFGIVSILLHWFSALAIIALLAIGYLVVDMSRGPLRSSLLHWHMSIALIAAPVLLYRIFWRLRHGKPRAPQQHWVVQLAADWVWRLLLISIVIQLVVGPLLVWAHGRPLEIFRIPVIPSPLPPMNELHATVLKPIHTWVGYAMGVLIAVHVAGALKHWLVDRDAVLKRMIWPPARNAGASTVGRLAGSVDGNGSGSEGVS